MTEQRLHPRQQKMNAVALDQTVAAIRSTFEEPEEYSVQVNRGHEWMLQLTELREEMKKLDKNVESLEELPTMTPDGERIPNDISEMVHNLHRYMLEIVNKVDAIKKEDQDFLTRVTHGEKEPRNEGGKLNEAQVLYRGKEPRYRTRKHDD